MDSHIYTGAGTGAQFNPFRYRGYYYDSDLGFYYLNSRYYDANTGRFINVDDHSVITATPDALTDKNLYAYCDNNPVMRADNGGEFWHILVGAAVGVVSQYVSDVVSNLVSGAEGIDVFKPTSSIVDYIAAGASGALSASGVGAVGARFASAAIDGTAYLFNQAIDGEKVDILELGVTLISSAAGAEKGIDGKNLRGIYKHSKNVLKTTTSKKKIAMYTGKMMDVEHKVCKKIRSKIIDSIESGFKKGAKRRFGFE